MTLMQYVVVLISQVGISVNVSEVLESYHARRASEVLGEYEEGLE